jgi:hypothetical protein
MPNEESTIEPAAGPGVPEHTAAIHNTAVQAPGRPAYDPIEDEGDWFEEQPEELPRRPRRRLLGVGGNPIALALLGVLMIAGGFIAGVLVEKGETSSTPASGGSGAGLAARFAGLRGGAAGASATGGASSGAAASGSGATAGGGSFGRSGGSAGSGTGGGATAGQVSYLAGSTLYVTTAEGNTVKVTTSAGSTVTKTVKADVKGIHPGETVVVTGAAGANGAISAESIRVGGGGGGGGLSALLGGSGAGAGRGSGGSGGGSSGGGEPALFGKGG